MLDVLRRSAPFAAGCCGPPTPARCSSTACWSSASWRGPRTRTTTRSQVRAREAAPAGGISPPVPACGVHPAHVSDFACTPHTAPPAADSQLIPLMPALLRHPDASVRARSCNLLGNLCRHRCVGVLRFEWQVAAPICAHDKCICLPAPCINQFKTLAHSACSPRFYADLAQHGVVAALIELCRDPDRAARKFACFAIGNAGGCGSFTNQNGCMAGVVPLALCPEPCSCWAFTLPLTLLIIGTPAPPT